MKLEITPDKTMSLKKFKEHVATIRQTMFDEFIDQ
jgi:hypothetical protein